MEAFRKKPGVACTYITDNSHCEFGDTFED